MTLTNTSAESINPVYRHNVFNFIIGNTKIFAKEIAITPVAMPAPTLDERTAYVWNAMTENHLNELGIIALSIPARLRINRNKNQWYCGMIPSLDYGKACLETVHDELALPRALIEHANFGPTNLDTAFSLLQTMYRK